MPWGDLYQTAFGSQPGQEALLEEQHQIKVMGPEKVRKIDAPEVVRHLFSIAIDRVQALLEALVLVVPGQLVPTLGHVHVTAETGEGVNGLRQCTFTSCLHVPTQVGASDTRERLRG
jgi:hypothetical protein